MANIAFTATTTSQVLPIAGIRAFHITNMGVNPVTLKFSEAGAAIFGEGIVLQTQYSTFSYESSTLFLGVSSVISQVGPSSLAIFYL